MISKQPSGATTAEGLSTSRPPGSGVTTRGHKAGTQIFGATPSPCDYDGNSHAHRPSGRDVEPSSCNTVAHATTFGRGGIMPSRQSVEAKRQ